MSESPAPVGSILADIKQMLGIDHFSTEFDVDVIAGINTAIFELGMIGIDPLTPGFMVEGSSETWVEFIGARKDLAAVKSFIFVNVRLIFDRPESSYGIQALERQRDRWAWQLQIKGQEAVS